MFLTTYVRYFDDWIKNIFKALTTLIVGKQPFVVWNSKDTLIFRTVILSKNYMYFHTKNINIWRPQLAASNATKKIFLFIFKEKFFSIGQQYFENLTLLSEVPIKEHLFFSHRMRCKYLKSISLSKIFNNITTKVM